MKMKSKLMAVSLMLVVSILMMSTASFAWFTISTAPEIKGIEATAATNENLEIALAKDTSKPSDSTSKTGDNYTWGNLVNLDATTKLDGTEGTNEYNTFMSNLTIRPMKLNDAKNGFTAPTYGADGRISSETGMTLTVGANSGAGFGTVTDSEGHVYGYFMDFWVRTNVDAQKLILTEADNRAESMKETAGNGSTIKSTNVDFEDNLRIAVQVLGSQAYGGTYAASAGNIVEATTNVVEGASNNTISAPTDGFFTMTKDTAYLIRVFVYVDGTNVTNSIGYNPTDFVASLNIQFKAADVDANMDVPTVS